MDLDSAIKNYNSESSNSKNNLIFGFLSFVFLIEWILLAFNVNSREDWFLENILVFIFIVPSIWLYFKGHLSITAYACLTLFLMFHSIGAHYTYSLVPYEEFFKEFTGISLNSLFGWQRNHYDRWVHFLWGLLIFFPLKDLLGSYTKIKGISLIVFTVFSIIVGSTIYEVIEWLAAIVFGGDLGIAYVGTQGDVWDTQKDQLLAIIGAAFACLFWYLSKKYFREQER